MSRLLTTQEAEEYRELISQYRPNNEVLELFRASRFAVIAGPAGAGKDTLRDALISRYPEQYVPILSTTTRPSRAGEVDALAYHFRDVAQVRQELLDREFFQAALVHDQQISCLHSNEIKKLNPDQTGLSILIPTTEAELRALNPELKTLFLIPPSIDSLRNRITAERILDEAELSRRLSAAAKEIERALESAHYYCIVTETIESVVSRAHGFLQSDEVNAEVDSYARRTMRQILEQLN